MLDVLPKDRRFISTRLERHTYLAGHGLSNTTPHHTYDEHLTAVLMGTYKAREYYDQVRYIDRDGMKQIRIQRVNGRPFLVDNENRRNKSNRPYFAENIELSASSIYISPIDLNQEFGRIALTIHSPRRLLSRSLIACSIATALENRAPPTHSAQTLYRYTIPAMTAPTYSLSSKSCLRPDMRPIHALVQPSNCCRLSSLQTERFLPSANIIESVAQKRRRLAGKLGRHGQGA